MMKFTLVLFAVLATVGLGQAHKVPNFGKGPLHEDIQDVLDLIPMEKIAEVFLDYLAEDSEVKAAAKYLEYSSLLTDLLVDIQAIPEVRNLLNYLQKADIDIYGILNAINKAFGIKPIEPPMFYSTYTTTATRTGGIAGLFKDIKKLFHYDDFIKIYVRKMKTSQAFFDFIQQLKSDNFQQIVNKLYESKSFQTILGGIRNKGVNLQIIADIMYIVLGITVPKDSILPKPERSLNDELRDFVKILPIEEYTRIVTEYVSKDMDVQKAMLYLLTPEFHALLRAVEALKEHQEIVTYLEKTGLGVIESIKAFHRAIGMEEYVPPKIETTFESQIGVQKVGDGMKGMFDDLLAVTPVDKIQELYNEKMKTSKVFADFVAKMRSPELKKLANALVSHKTYQEMVAKSQEAGLDFKAMREFYKKILPVPNAMSHL